MKTSICIKVISGAKHSRVKEEGDAFKVYTTAPALDGEANKAVIVLLAQFYKVRKSAIRITKGLKSREKTINIWAN